MLFSVFFCHEMPHCLYIYTQAESRQGGNMQEKVKQPPVYSGVCKSGKRVFFFDVKKASNNTNYLIVSESSFDKEGNKRRNSLMIFNNELSPFIEEMKKAAEHFEIPEPAGV